MSIIKLIVGLANPGSEYEGTRHNAGAWYVEKLALDHNQCFEKKNKFHGYTANINLCGQNIKLLIPSTFMNLSGQSVSSVTHFYHIKPAEVLIAHDELDLVPGCAKLKFGGHHSGHNGLKDIINKLGNDAGFYRLRIGIGHPGNKHQVTHYVLSKPSHSEKKQIDDVINQAVACTTTLIKENMDAAINKLHSHNKSNKARGS